MAIKTESILLNKILKSIVKKVMDRELQYESENIDIVFNGVLQLKNIILKNEIDFETFCIESEMLLKKYFKNQSKLSELASMKIIESISKKLPLINGFLNRFKENNKDKFDRITDLFSKEDIHTQDKKSCMELVVSMDLKDAKIINMNKNEPESDFCVAFNDAYQNFYKCYLNDVKSILPILEREEASADQIRIKHKETNIDFRASNRMQIEQKAI